MVSNRTLASWLVIAAMAGSGVATLGCGGNPSSPALTLENAFGELDVHMTDAAIDGVSAVHVWITGFSTQLEGGTGISFQKEIGDVELLSLNGTSIQVVDADVPAGTYSFVGFDIDASRSYLIEQGVKKPISIPDGSVRVDGPFVVNPSALTSITLDFDAAQSLTQNPDGSWHMNPVVVVMLVAVTGG